MDGTYLLAVQNMGLHGDCFFAVLHGDKSDEAKPSGEGVVRYYHVTFILIVNRFRLHYQIHESRVFQHMISKMRLKQQKRRGDVFDKISLASLKTEFYCISVA